MSFHSEIPHSLLLYGRIILNWDHLDFFLYFYHYTKCCNVHSSLCTYVTHVSIPTSGLVIHLRRCTNLYPHQQHSEVPDSYHP